MAYRETLVKTEQDVVLNLIQLPYTRQEEKRIQVNTIAVSTTATPVARTELIIRRSPDNCVTPADQLHCVNEVFNPARFCQPKYTALSANGPPPPKRSRSDPLRPPGTGLQAYNLLAISSPSPSPPPSREHSPRPPTPPNRYYYDSPDYQREYSPSSSPRFETQFCPAVSPIRDGIDQSPPSPTSTASTLSSPPPPPYSPHPPPPEPAIAPPPEPLSPLYEPVSPASPATDSGFDSDSCGFQRIQVVLNGQDWPVDAVNVLPGNPSSPNATAAYENVEAENTNSDRDN